MLLTSVRGGKPRSVLASRDADGACVCYEPETGRLVRAATYREALVILNQDENAPASAPEVSESVVQETVVEAPSAQPFGGDGADVDAAVVEGSRPAEHRPRRRRRRRGGDEAVGEPPDGGRTDVP